MSRFLLSEVVRTSEITRKNENSVWLLLNSLKPIDKEHKIKSDFLTNTAKAFLSSTSVGDYTSKWEKSNKTYQVSVWVSSLQTSELVTFNLS